MTINEIRAAMNWIKRKGELDALTEDRLEDAIFSLETGNEYRAADSLRGAMNHLEESGKSESAKAIRRIL